MTTTEQLLTKNDNELIDMAVALLIKNQPIVEIKQDEYKINVRRNSENVAVDFIRIIRYVPLGINESDLEFDITINLSNQAVSPFGTTLRPGKFYIPSAQDLESLAFVKEYFGSFTSEFINTIHEEVEEYKISCTNEVAFGYYTLNKKTGLQGPSLQGSYFQMTKPLQNEGDGVFNGMT